ncbi:MULTISPECIES: SMP-30/gluconolactonase/LRE family protein [unclassified Pseudoalteromonas]|uniref:SMP-30/gluconolactonase/LRE family protein n=1 Tax=unclassified Pseudoalteromonas TaxID=194690 RepID=UPI001F171105|nr:MULTISPECIES: SMP-30/gluconolactonase/LRE family protein [unclassified Pseudoalteromonas]MCF2828541.1 SMP-30/gluconolactonase/LRE family protein [Pseudoalteromonas sp. OF5H-5]MCF2831184.1 SMP-30/gluconolactonase/LRE family protein [Pseudoalteromonas sp. DL2-H6]MCF2924855.1 SMP-30/gluconolactonase/LRE family protein [Pseudoalteromonas sp. DL2-H1]
MRKVIFSLFLLQSSGYVAANTVVDTQDWITDGVFTQGIEGPAVDAAGVLYAVNHQQQGTIGKVTAQGRVVTLLTLKNGSIGNGIRFDKQGNMYIADYVNHNVLKATKAALAQGGDLSQSVSVFAHDNRMDQPNDLAIMDNGILFASDPNWQASSGKLWRINTNGAVTLLEADMGTTNGIEVSPDNKTLYVNESVQRKVWRYELDEQGNISNKQLFISFTDFGLDGMRTDNQGNLYIARYGAGVVAVVSPQGKLIKEIKLKGKYPTNVAFGGEEGKRLFITMQKRGAIEMVELPNGV